MVGSKLFVKPHYRDCGQVSLLVMCAGTTSLKFNSSIKSQWKIDNNDQQIKKLQIKIIIILIN